MIDKQQRSALKQLLQSPQWSVIEQLAEKIRANLKDEDVIRETEWETLSNTLIREGRARGIREFISELYKIAQSDEQ